jgi:glycosyltransferase involved in cell wall biosynthesis
MTKKNFVHRCQLPGFNVIGYVSGELGVSRSSQDFIRVLLKRGHPVAIYDMSPSRLGLRRDAAYAKYSVRDVRNLPYNINFFVLPVRDATEFLFSELAELISRSGIFNVYLPTWELDVLPGIAVKALSFCDLIVAYSDFVHLAFERSFPKKPIISTGHPVYLPPVSRMKRHFGLPQASTIFIFSFEPRSDIVRKNPFAVIRAFKMAFKSTDSAALVIKINSARRGKLKAHPQIEAIKRMCKGDDRIRIIATPLTYPDVLSLYRQCDVFVSLHRSEGLGLGPLEAMMLGKPVIATGWSGNLSYMNEHCACLVDYQLIPVKGDVKCYDRTWLGQEAYWADPRICDAAMHMRRLAGDADLRMRMGRSAAHTAAVYQKKAKRGFFIEQILRHYQLWRNKQNKKYHLQRNKQCRKLV